MSGGDWNSLDRMLRVYPNWPCWYMPGDGMAVGVRSSVWGLRAGGKAW